MQNSGRDIQSCTGTVFHSPASGSSPSVSAQGFRSTSQQPSWGITRQGPANKLTYGLYSAGISDAQKREDCGWGEAASGIKHAYTQTPSGYPSRVVGRGVRRFIFLREEEGLEPVQTLVPIAANARKPKMTNAAPRIFLQEGRFAVVRCAIHQGHQCGTLLPLSSFRRMTADCVSLQHVLAGTLKCGTHCNGDVALARTCPGVIPKNLRKAAPKADWLSKPAMAAALVGFSPTESAHIAAVRRAC